MGYLDWATQPDPFRRHEGAELRKIPQSAGPDPAPTWDSLFGPRLAPAAPDETGLGGLFFLSLALSAWKEALGPDGLVAGRWALRVNPSSGNLHPTEGWLATRDGLFHYRPDLHALERTAVWPDGAWAAATADLPAGTLLGGLSSIPWREAWKYGERAFRYCQHDVGHAQAALGLAAACLGWSVAPLVAAGADAMTRFLGLTGRDEAEAEHPDAVFAIFTGAVPAGPVRLALPTATVLGHAPNRLSPDHVDWEIITAVTIATAPPDRGPAVVTPPAPRTPPPAPHERGLGAAALIRGRRSAVAMDGVTTMSRDDFCRLLQRLLPTAGHPAFALLPRPPAVSLLLFVHRVDGLAPGLYVLARDPSHAADLRTCTRDAWQWSHPAGCPADLPLFFLGGGDLRAAARQVSCGQDIAADGAFAVGLLARFDGPLHDEGPAAYPQLFRETGAIGQMLYLEAEAAGLSGTGIGCFFDDEVHRILGLADHRWQSLYHFTVGGAVVDGRLRTADPYPPS